MIKTNTPRAPAGPERIYHATGPKIQRILSFHSCATPSSAMAPHATGPKIQLHHPHHHHCSLTFSINMQSASVYGWIMPVGGQCVNYWRLLRPSSTCTSKPLPLADVTHLYASRAKLPYGSWSFVNLMSVHGVADLRACEKTTRFLILNIIVVKLWSNSKEHFECAARFYKELGGELCAGGYPVEMCVQT